METQIPADLQQAFYHEDHRGDFSRAALHVEAQIRRSPSFTGHAWLAAVRLLQGDLPGAEAALQQAERSGAADARTAGLLARFRVIARFEAFERMPGEINLYSTDVAVRRAKTGGALVPQSDPLAPTGDRGLDELVQFLNARLRHWEWRSTRNLLRGMRFAPDPSGIVAVLRQQLDRCRALFEAGDGYAGLVAAGFCRAAGMADDMIAWLTQTGDLAEKNRDTALQANCLLHLGDWNGAPSTTPLLWNFAWEFSTTQSSALSAAVEATEFRMPTADAPGQAAQCWAQAEALFAEAGCPRGVAQIALRRAYRAFLDDDHAAAAAHAQAAGTQFSAAGDQLNARLADTHRMLARTLQNRVGEALGLARSVGGQLRDTGQTSWAVGLGLLAGRLARHLVLRRGQTELALKAYRVARTLHASAGATFHAAQHLTDLGELYKAAGHTEAAIVHFEQATDEIETILDTEWRDFSDPLNTNFHTRSGLAMLMSDNFMLGMNRADPGLMERAIGRMGAVCARIRAEAGAAEMTAMPQLGQVIGLYEQMAQQSRVLIPLYRARALRERGDFAGFEQSWQLAHDALATVDPLQQGVLGASVWGMKRDWVQAGAAMRRYLELSGPAGGFVGELLAFMEQFGEQGKAEIQLQQGYRLHSQALSGLVRTRQYADALPHYDALRHTYGEQWWQREEAPWQMLSDCGEMMEGAGRLDDALACYDHALEQLEFRRRQLSQDELRVALAGTQNTNYLFAYAARAALAAGQPARAFRYAELGKARGLLDLMAENRREAAATDESRQRSLELRAVDARRTALTTELAQLRMRSATDAVTGPVVDELAGLEARRLELEDNLGPGTARSEAMPALIAEAAAVAAALPAGTVLLEYLIAGDNLLLWALTPAGLVHAGAYTVEDWQLKLEINTLRSLVLDGQPWQSAADVLAGRLLQPVEDVVRAAAGVIVVAHGPLHTLPFQLLPLDGAPLGLGRAVRYVPSASALPFLGTPADLAGARVLAVGNPTGNLPAAAAEALFVARQFGAESDALIGAAATETAVRERLAGARILHLATHGELSEDAPLQSALLLADGDRLTVQELMGTRLHADLVVLSACDTARGTHTGGDDVLGLTRSLIAGGVRAAVVSLWPVNDLSTALLMGRFYSALKAGRAPAEALQEAQRYLAGLTAEAQQDALAGLERQTGDPAVRSLIARRRGARGPVVGAPQTTVGFSHPYYWAGFVLVGG